VTETSKAPHPAEVSKILSKAEHYKMAADFDKDVDEGFTRLVVSGSNLQLFQNNAAKWAPNAKLQGNAGPGKLAFMWSNTRIAEPPVIPTKPKDSKSDEDVLDLVPQSQILTEGQLDEVLERVNKGIDEAYPGVTISHPQYGKGKLDLVLLLMDRLFSVSSRNLHRYASICTLGLLGQLQTAKGGVPDHAALPSSPNVLARR